MVFTPFFVFVVIFNSQAKCWVLYIYRITFVISYFVAVDTKFITRVRSKNYSGFICIAHCNIINGFSV